MELNPVLPVKSWSEYLLPKAILHIRAFASADTVFEMSTEWSEFEQTERIMAEISSFLMERKESMRLELGHYKMRTLRICLQ
jgi:hypothetical protein